MFGCGRSLDKPSTDWKENNQHEKFELMKRGSKYLRARDGQEADAHHHTTDSNLTITKLDAIKVDDTQTVGTNQAVQSKNFVHLDRGNQSATTLADNVRNSNNVGQLAGERRGTGSVTQLNGGRLTLI
jgi:hypothetical protein